MLLKKAELMKTASDKESDIKTDFSKQKNESNLEVFSNISGMEMQSISIKIKNKIAQHLSSLK